ncbi:MAG: protein kinase [Kiritimatiellia bacterium]|jgi:serine/threonine-protein kinase|nr:protein kinase [Kiritimatiellia bacterium]
MDELRIPGFEVLELIGRGGMASVWKARQLSLDRVVAIKVLSTRFIADSSDIDRFQAEARAAAKLKHQGIVQVYDTGTSEGLHYIVMEYVDGYTVGDWLRRKEVLSEEDALLVAECVADALDNAWKKAGLIHCDIKPDNVIIDADGAVKVADLGLAKSLISMSTEEESDEILGTPAYISPEQARGEMDLDCRSDIYSLGAMLYNLVTGRRLFAGISEEEIIEQQCVGVESNPCDVNQSLSAGMGMLIEKMLAKERKYREKDWEAVRADISRVKHGHFPHGRLPEAALSTVEKSKRVPVKSRSSRSSSTLRRLRRREVSAGKTFLILGLVSVVAVVLAFYIKRQAEKPVEPVPSPDVSVPPDVVGVEPEPGTEPGTVTPDEEAAKRRAERRELAVFEAVMAWVDGHPDEPENAIAKLNGALELLEGTDYETGIKERISAIKELRTANVAQIMDELDAAVQPLLAAGRFEDAAIVYENYDGQQASETAQLRLEAAARVRAEGLAAETAAVSKIDLAEQAFKALMTKVAKSLLSGDILQAVVDISSRIDEGGIAGKTAELESLKTLLTDAAGVDARILESFKQQRGRTVRVELTSGATDLTILDVEGDSIMCKRRISSSVASASRQVTIRIADLATRERLIRMGSDTLPEVALVKGLMAIRSKAFSYAEKYLADVSAPLRDALLAEMKSVNEKPDTEPGSVVVGPGTEPEIVENELPLRPLPIEYRPIENDAKAVVALLRKRNPGIGDYGIALKRGPDGLATSLTIKSDRLKDLAPVMALRTLKSLTCLASSYGIHDLKDIACLKGMRLKHLELQECPITDISPLRSMRLVSLGLHGTQVRDLSPLRGMPLQEIDLSETKILEIGALRGMPLKRVNLDNTDVRRFTSLNGAPLTYVSVRGCKMQDFNWLKGLKLSHLDLSNTGFRQISMLSGMPLTHLYLDSTRVGDIAVLEDKELVCLDIGGTEIRDFTPLSTLKLQELYLDDTSFDDVGLLDLTPLTKLSLARSKVRDLAHLQGARLSYLDIEGTAVKDISTLTGMPLTTFKCRKAPIASLEPLRDMPIRSIWLDQPIKSSTLYALLPALAYRNGSAVYRGK